MFEVSLRSLPLRYYGSYHPLEFVLEFGEAATYFQELQKHDPFRVEDIDIFSNILYVTEKRADLATLAQEYTKVDRARPEVCCLVGQYCLLVIEISRRLNRLILLF